MKKVRIPFSLDEYEKGGYEVETRGDEDNKPQKSRILCTDKKCKNYPILALILDENENIENTAYYRLNGMYSYMCEAYLDLVLVKQEFEDGDIIKRGISVPYIIPYRGTNNSGSVLTDSFYDFNDNTIYILTKIDYGCGFTKEYCLATEEEKKIFFDALEKVGKIWNAETKHIESIKPKYNLQPFDKVLVRDEKCQYWDADIFSYRDSEEDDYSFHCLGGKKYDQCIPYNDETKYLLGTSYDTPEKYKN